MTVPMSDGPTEAGAASAGAGNVIDTHRLEAFSDGVMAVIITIMAFDLKTPGAATLHGLASRLPSLLVYVLSFTVIGIYWNNHHHLLRATGRINAAVMWTNMHLLFWLSLIPFATEWVGTTHARTLPAATYGVVALGAALAYFALVRAILRANSDDAGIAAAVGKDIKGIISPVVYVVGLGLASVSPYLAYACYAAVSLLWFVPDRRLAEDT
ncbi:MAG: TMEM175 family protein [Acidimicrobiales bacterium]